MDRILLQKKNEAMLLVGCDNGIAMELSEFFSFFVPGYKYMPLFRNKVWDGKVRLFNPASYELPVGLLSYVKEFAEKRGYIVEYEDGPFGPPESFNKIDAKDIMSFIKSLDIHSKGKAIEVRDYQFNAICESIRKKRAILLSPTGSGKSLIIYILMRWYMANYDDKVLVIVPTTSLVQQMMSDFGDYSSNDSGFSEEDCHAIFSGQAKMNISENVFISTWQSIYKLPITWFSQFGVIFGDEVHGFKSKSLSNIMNKAKTTTYRFGTTGTLDGTQTHKLVLEGLFGKVMKVTTTKALQDKETLAALDIFILRLEHGEDVRQLISGSTYQQEINFIIGNEKRNHFIRNLALDQKGNSLVLFQFVEKHGKILYELIQSKADINRKVFFVSGATEATDREAIRKITEKQKDAIIVASLGTFSTGINIRNLHNIIFASPSKSQIKVLQSIGRGLRKSDNGVTTKLYDISDDIQYKSKKNYTLLHSEARIKIYKREQFNFKLYKIKV